MANFRTPLRQARGMGSAKHGVGHFIGQRVSAVALIFLVLWGVTSALSLNGAGYEDAVGWLQHPLNATLLALTIIAGCYHMQLGMRVIIEDYITAPGSKLALLILNLFVAWGAGALAIVSLLKVAVGGGAH
ncbi:succinate dehydrogenase, hydrophobic membrane anchor protein [Caulobacter sp. KR2-114]|uniref:succinate dehydrogenase, hydrophobic membrane anchor protein n=1 Tax=Caulobacter sp. KR2-114 TaxID=3400912 RepID=UPI003C00E611